MLDSISTSFKFFEQPQAAAKVESTENVTKLGDSLNFFTCQSLRNASSQAWSYSNWNAVPNRRQHPLSIALHSIFSKIIQEFSTGISKDEVDSLIFDLVIINKSFDLVEGQVCKKNRLANEIMKKNEDFIHFLSGNEFEKRFDECEMKVLSFSKHLSDLELGIKKLHPDDDQNTELLKNEITIQSLLEKNTPQLRAALRNIIKQFEQISEMSREKHGLTNAQCLRLAYFIEIKLAGCAGPIEYVNKKLLCLPRSLVFMKLTGIVYILSKRNVSVLNAEGSSKRVTSAICLPTLESKKRAYLVAQTVTRDLLSNQGKVNFLRDLWIHKQIIEDSSDAVGIWHCINEDSDALIPFQYLKTHKQSHNFILKHSFFSPIADASLESIKDEINFDRLLITSLRLINGLHAIYKTGYAHADLKLANALTKKCGDDYIVGLIDFGFSFNPSKEPQTFIFDFGYYGSIICTPPEVYGNPGFASEKDSYFKADVWALGYMFYELYFKQKPSWSRLLFDSYDNGKYHPIDNLSKNKMDKLVKQIIEEPFKILCEKGTLNQKEQFEKLIYNLMRLDPKLRFSTLQALQSMKTILEFK